MTIDVLQFNPANWIQASDPNTLYDAETGGSLVAAGGAEFPVAAGSNIYARIQSSGTPDPYELVVYGAGG